MIRLIEAMNYRSLKRIRQPLEPFEVLVGPNASGKSTFLDVLAFLSTLARDGLDAAIAERGTIYDLMWQREGERFELAVEAVVPGGDYPPLPLHLSGEGYAIRYELAVGVDAMGTARILDEQILLTECSATLPRVPRSPRPHTIFIPPGEALWNTLLHKNGSEFSLSAENARVPADAGNQMHIHRSNGQHPVFRSMKAEDFPTPVWLEHLLRKRVERIDLQSDVLRAASRAGQGDTFTRNGSNFPWMIDRFEKSNATQFEQWISHIRSALPDIKAVKTIEREEDRHRYLMVEYTNGLRVPSWALSEGTLCFLALTFLAYQSKPGDVYLIEEPESHIHPLNIEPVIQSLSSVYGGQVLISTHSPAVLAMTDVENVLVFSRDEETGAHAVSGKDHPRLRDWKGEVSLGTLFAGGVLG